MKESEIRNPMVHDRYLEMVRRDALAYFDDVDRCERVSCPSCRGENVTDQFEKFGFTYAQCDACRTLYVNPRPKLMHLEDFYVNSPSSQFWVDEFFKPLAEMRREKLFRPRAKLVAKMLNQSDSITVGDIGAGFGIFLDELRKLVPGARCIAIEPSPEMAEICRNNALEVHETIIEKMKGNAGEFDFLSAFELFEHLHTPRSMIEAAFNLLKSGGRLLVTTLNAEGFDIQLLWEKSKSVFPPHHLNFCNPDSLSRLLCDVGFEIISVETPGVLDWDIVEGAIDTGQLETERFWQHVAQQGSAECKNELQRWLTKNNLSSHMRIVAQKP
jgi:SAM-dependent methyltransferase